MQGCQVHSGASLSYSVQITRRSTSKPFKCPQHNEELRVGTGHKQEKTGGKRMQGAGPLGGCLITCRHRAQASQLPLASFSYWVKGSGE